MTSKLEHVFVPGVPLCSRCGQREQDRHHIVPVKHPEYCGDCDGVGWVEGGKTIKTTCETCGGTGWAP